MDVKTVFLNENMEEEILMKISDGLENAEKVKSIKVRKQKKSLYGLKASPRNRIRSFLKKHGNQIQEMVYIVPVSSPGKKKANWP